MKIKHKKKIKIIEILLIIIKPKSWEKRKLTHLNPKVYQEMCLLIN